MNQRQTRGQLGRAGSDMRCQTVCHRRGSDRLNTVPKSADQSASVHYESPGILIGENRLARLKPLVLDDPVPLDVLRDGGSALDAAIAVQLVLGLVEPQSSGIGGGAFIMHWDGSRVQAFDGRETAPRKMPQDAFIDPATGKPYNFTPELVTSGVGVGTLMFNSTVMALGIAGIPIGMVADWRRAVRAAAARRARLRRRNRNRCRSDMAAMTALADRGFSPQPKAAVPRSGPSKNSFAPCIRGCPDALFPGRSRSSSRQRTAC